MRVHFTTITDSEYDHALRSVMKSARGSVGVKTLAVLVRGLGLNVPSDEVRRWIRLNGKGTFADGVVEADGNRDDFVEEGAPPIGARWHEPRSLAAFVEGGASWGKLVRAAERRNLSSTSLSGDGLRDVRLKYARCMYAALLVPAPAMEETKISGRANLLAALAFVSKRIIEHETGWNRTPVAHDWLATHLGWDTGKTAGRHLQHLVELDFLTNPQGGKSVIGKYSLRQVSKAGIVKVKQYEDSIIAFVDGKPGALAAIIKSVDHPAWCYSGVLGHEHRLVLMADAAEIAPRSLGVTVKKERQIRRVLEAAELAPVTAHSRLTKILDGLAIDTEYGRLDPATGRVLTPLAHSERAWVEWQAKSDESRRRREDRAEVKRKVLEGSAAVAITSAATGDPWFDDTAEGNEIDRRMDDVLQEWDELYPLPYNPMEGDPASADEREEQFSEWILGLHQEVIANDPADEFRTRGSKALITRMLDRGYAEQLARGAIRFIMDAPENALADPYLTSTLAD